MKHRSIGYEYLSGKGVEIGAFCEPAPLGKQCEVSYFDAITAEEAAEKFPEIDPAGLVKVELLGDIDKRGLRDAIAEGSLDFIIANHVIEHVANPIAMLEDMVRAVKRGGVVVLTAPDKRFTFDHERSLTTFDHLREEFEEEVDHVTDEHYMDFLGHVGKHVFEEPGRDIQKDVEFVRGRREHAHVWDSQSFLSFVEAAASLLGIEFELLYKSLGEENQIECFLVMRIAK
ncbi:class I SAM-dependent methyltransferase [Puniceicoccaceae bacterium K14]|nr:class I SAM-dependent methyltransferase [Puniceicoccaceae bacterium K14]